MSIPTAHRRPSRTSGRAGRLTPELLLTSIGLGTAAVAWWPTHLTMTSPAPFLPAAYLAHLTGLVAGYGVLVMIGLMSRAPALERGIGADVLTRWHARGGRIILSLILVHAWAAVDGWAVSRGESLLTAAWHVLRLPWLMAATVGTVMLLAVGVASARAARRRLSYEKWHALHLLTYVAVALSFVHQLAGPDLSGHRWIQVGWALLYTHVFTLVLRHRLIAPLRQARRHRLRVSSVIPEGPGVVSIEVERQHLDELQAEAGQFFRWRFLTPDHWATAHPFSLSAAPTDHRLRLTVKALGTGSTGLQNLPAGTWVIAEGPYGAITSDRRTRRNVLLVAGGVGITPMRALFETMPVEPGQDLALIYRARSAAQILFHDELVDIAQRRGARLLFLVGDRPDCLSPQELIRLVPDLAARDVYLCGPAGLADTVRTSVREAGLPARNLHEERFSF